MFTPSIVHFTDTEVWKARLKSMQEHFGADSISIAVFSLHKLFVTKEAFTRKHKTPSRKGKSFHVAGVASRVLEVAGEKCPVCLAKERVEASSGGSVRIIVPYLKERRSKNYSHIIRILLFQYI